MQVGVLEYWNTGVMVYGADITIQYSNTPLLHYSAFDLSKDSGTAMV
jgi:hypothetical protein